MEFKTRLYVTDIEYLNDKNIYNQMYSILPQCRKDKTDHYKMMDDKRRSVAAGVLLVWAYNDVIDSIGRGSIKMLPEIVTGTNGKPKFNDSIYCFNISHSGNIVACAISTGAVGCDVEKKEDRDFRITNRFFTPSECQYIKENGQNAFKTVWSMKESFLKATGLGISYPMNGFNVIENMRPIDSLVFKEDTTEYYFKTYDLNNGYGCACCSESNMFEENARIVYLSEIAETLLKGL